MNVLDSELVRGHLKAMGYAFTEASDQADIVLFNTCSVRAQAENKVLSRLGLLRIEKNEGRKVIVGVIGCLAEREGEAMLRRLPEVDLMCGPGELDRLPMLLDNVLKGNVLELADRAALQGASSRRSTTLSAAQDSLELLDLSRAFDPEHGGAGGRSAYVRITRGCNKFCTYCVVPNTRGAEVHRPPSAIVDECRRLAEQGVIEITLLGQTVNHYMYVHGIAIDDNGRELPQVGPGLAAFRRADRGAGSRRVTTFADLLRRIHDEVPQILRLRFVTSYPRDFGDDILEVMAHCPRICQYLHVPAQSGSDRILGLMNRGYTVGQYEAFANRVLQQLPEASIAGDFIVGFPTETDADFQASIDLLGRVPFKNNFIFKYSPRPGTTAINRLPDDVPESVKRERCNALLAVQADVSEAAHKRVVGQVQQVFVEKATTVEPQSSGAGNVTLGWAKPQVQYAGRTQGDLITVFDGPRGEDPLDGVKSGGTGLIGKIVSVFVESAAPRLLRGRMVSCSSVDSR
jgi:tRNA-2-methylthio-N6-dimethylallyladenosine synthase